jgi:hypothetical protein
MARRIVAATAWVALTLGASLIPAQPPPGKCALSDLEAGHLATLRGIVSFTGHDALLNLSGCTEQVVLAFAWESEAGLEDHSIGDRLRKDRVFREFEKKATAKDSRGVFKFNIEVTLTGRIDVTSIEGLEKKLLRDRVGFGHPVAFTRYRLVILWMSDVVARPRTFQPSIR